MSKQIALHLGRTLERLYIHRVMGKLTWQQFKYLYHCVITEFNE